MGKIVIIYAHPNPKSFNHALLEAAEAALKAAHQEYVVRDLYELKWDPVLKPEDFVAFHNGEPSADIKREQEIIGSADKVIILHPVWWMSFPAILKGYIDRVFFNGFAYKYGANGPEGLLKKKIWIFSTTGMPQQMFGNAMVAPIDVGTFKFCGFTSVIHEYFYGIPTSTLEDRKKILAEFEAKTIPAVVKA